MRKALPVVVFGLCLITTNDLYAQAKPDATTQQSATVSETPTSTITKQPLYRKRGKVAVEPLSLSLPRQTAENQAITQPTAKQNAAKQSGAKPGVNASKVSPRAVRAKPTVIAAPAEQPLPSSVK